MPEIVGEICRGGQCVPIPPEVAFAIMAVSSLITKLNKGDDAFGPNNDLVKILSNLQDDILNGPSDSNDIVKAMRNAWSDIKNGPGENNDIVKFFKNFGINL